MAVPGTRPLVGGPGVPSPAGGGCTAWMSPELLSTLLRCQEQEGHPRELESAAGLGVLVSRQKVRGGMGDPPRGTVPGTAEVGL